MKFNLYGLLEEMTPAEGSNGGGSGGESNPENKDIEINDDDLKGGNNKGSENSKDDGLEDIKKELEDLREDKKNRDHENTINSIFHNLKKDYPDIDRSKVENKLKEIAKDNPDEAKRLNNPAGFELLHIKYFQTNDPGNDDFNPGREEKEKFDFDETYDKFQKGDRKSVNKLLDNAVSTTHNYKR